jgi:hypothetical protein
VYQIRNRRSRGVEDAATSKLGETVGHIANRSQSYRIMERSRHSYSVQLGRANINDFFTGTPVLVDRLSNEDEGVSIL